MAGRGRVPRQPFDDGRRVFLEFPEERFMHGLGSRPPHPSVLQQELELEMIELRRLAAQNRGLVEERAVFQQELLVAKDEIRRLNLVIADVCSDKEIHIRNLVEKGLKIEASLRATEPLRNEVVQLRAEVQKLNAARQELDGQIQNLTQELKRAQSDNQQIPALKAEINGLKQELHHARVAIDYAKKGNVGLLEQRQAMEQNLVSMAREIEKLKAELATNEGRPWGNSGYGVKIGTSAVAFPAAYGDAYGRGVGEKTTGYGGGPGSWGAPDKSHPGRF